MYVTQYFLIDKCTINVRNEEIRFIFMLKKKENIDIPRESFLEMIL